MSKPAALLLLLAAACAAPAPWRQDVLPQETPIRLEHDRVGAFGRVRLASDSGAADSVVLMGGKYWYVLDAPSSAAALSVLQSGLPGRYLVQRHEWHPYRRADAADNLLELDIEWDAARNAKQFRTRACLRYNAAPQPENAAHAAASDAASGERIRLARAGFSPISGLTDAYTRCLPLNGRYFAKPAADIPRLLSGTLPVLLRIHGREAFRPDASDTVLSTNTLDTLQVLPQGWFYSEAEYGRPK